MSRRSRIMIVAHNPHEIRMVASAFERAQWVVDMEAISSGQLAIDAMCRNHDMKRPTDLVMLASILNGESCLHTLRSIRNHPGFECQPVIVFSSARPAPDIAHACSMLGALKFLEIPADLSNWILLEMRLKSQFPAEGQLTQCDIRTNSRRLAGVKALAGS